MKKYVQLKAIFTIIPKLNYKKTSQIYMLFFLLDIPS